MPDRFFYYWQEQLKEVQTCWRESNSHPCKYQILISVPLLLEQIFNTCSTVINYFLSQQFTQSLKSGYWKTKVFQFVSKYVHEDNIGALRGKLNHQDENDWLIQEFYMWKNGTEAHHRVINPIFQISFYHCPVILNYLCSARMDPDGVQLV